MSKAIIKRTRLRKKMLVYMLGGVCSRCGFEGPYCCYDFHHRDPLKKFDSINYLMGLADENALMVEIKKCTLLCANCHRVEHHGDWDSG